MKRRFWLCRRNRTYCIKDALTGKRTSLKTTDAQIASRLFQANVDADRQPQLNLCLAKIHLAAADPKLLPRTWQTVMDEFIGRSRKASTKERRERALRCKAFDVIRQKKIVETTADDLRAVITASGVYTNDCLKCLHNLAQGMGWLPWPIIPVKLWPKSPTRTRRAISAQEHQQIIVAEKNVERRLYYELLWEVGAAQSDAANLTAENIDWHKRQLSYRRMKTSEWCHLSIGARLEALLRQLPREGALFPKISKLKDTWRSAEFSRRCKLLKLAGVSLHSYRYAWAERAYATGVPERYAQAALGHSSAAVHWAYARKGLVVCPSLEEYEKKIVPLPTQQAV